MGPLCNQIEEDRIMLENLREDNSIQKDSCKK